MNKYVYTVVAYVACLLMLPLPANAAGQFDGKYSGTTNVLSFVVPTTIDITGSDLKGRGELNTVQAVAGGWSQNEGKVNVHFDITIEGKIGSNGNVSGTVKGNFSISADRRMAAVFNNQFSGTLSGEDFVASPTITLKIIECSPGMNCKDNESGNIGIHCKRTGVPAPTGDKPPGPLVASLPAPPGEEPLGVVTEFRGTVYVSAGPYELPPSQQKWIIVKNRQPLYKGWMVRTSSDSEAGLLWGTGAFTRTKPLTWFEAQKFETKQTSQWTMYGRLYEGIMSFYGQKAKEDTRKFEFETDRAILTIPGTTFILEVTPSQTLLKVIEGTIEFKSKTSGLSAIVQTGESITAGDKGLGQKSKFDISAEKAKWGDLTGGVDKNTSTTNNGPLSNVKCPIKVAYQSEDNTELALFRRFRDHVLLTSGPGKAFVDAYYAYGPAIAPLIAENEPLRFIIREMLLEPLALALAMTYHYQ